MAITVEDLVTYVRKNKESLTLAVREQETSPYALRNAFAEDGIELTPDELNTLCDIVRTVIDYINNEEDFR